MSFGRHLFLGSRDLFVCLVPCKVLLLDTGDVLGQLFLLLNVPLAGDHNAL